LSWGSEQEVVTEKVISVMKILLLGMRVLAKEEAVVAVEVGEHSPDRLR
jgi:hypothetical protein